MTITVKILKLLDPIYLKQNVENTKPMTYPYISSILRHCRGSLVVKHRKKTIKIPKRYSSNCEKALNKTKISKTIQEEWNTNKISCFENYN